MVSVPSTGVLNIHKLKHLPLLILDKESICKMCSFDKRPLHSIVDMMLFT